MSNWFTDTHLLLSERDIGTIEKTERARVITPIIRPPVCRLTQQQHLLKHGMMSSLVEWCTKHRCEHTTAQAALPASAVGRFDR